MPPAIAADQHVVRAPGRRSRWRLRVWARAAPRAGDRVPHHDRRHRNSLCHSHLALCDGRAGPARACAAHDCVEYARPGSSRCQQSAGRRAGADCGERRGARGTRGGSDDSGGAVVVAHRCASGDSGYSRRGGSACSTRGVVVVAGDCANAADASAATGRTPTGCRGGWYHAGAAGQRHERRDRASGVDRCELERRAASGRARLPCVPRRPHVSRAHSPRATRVLRGA